jgi:hypothetical protein
MAQRYVFAASADLPITANRHSVVSADAGGGDGFNMSVDKRGLIAQGASPGPSPETIQTARTEQ